MTNFFISICLIFMLTFLPRVLALMETSCSRRLRMKDWLYNLLERGDIRGLCWEDRSSLIFRIEWKHGSRHGYSFEKDAIVFREWAEYTGKLKRNHGPDPKRWKANFRCALNSLKNIRKIDCKQDRGTDAFRRYQFMLFSGNGNKDNGDTRKIKMEVGEVKRCKTSIPAPELEQQEMKIKEEKPDCPVRPHESDSSGAFRASFYYPLDEDKHFKWMTPPRSPETKVTPPVVSGVAQPAVIRCNSCDLSVWGCGHSPFCKESNPPMTPPLTPHDLVLPDLDIESLSPSQAVVLSTSFLDEFNDFEECASHM